MVRVVDDSIDNHKLRHSLSLLQTLMFVINSHEDNRRGLVSGVEVAPWMSAKNYGF